MRHWQEYFPRESRCPPVIYLDLWPTAPLLAIVNDPALCAQAVQQKSLPRSWQSKFLVSPLTKGIDLGSAGTDIAFHRLLRSQYAPAFSPKNLMAGVPALVEEASVFADCIRTLTTDNGTWGEVFSLEEKASALVFEVMARFTVDLHLGEQTNGHSALRTAILRQTGNLVPKMLTTLPRRSNPLYHLDVWRTNQKIKGILEPMIRSRFYSGDEMGLKYGRRTSLDVVVNAWRAGNRLQHSRRAKEAMINSALQNVKMFMLAGVDSTTASICFTLQLLGRNPRVLERLRAEHLEAFGPNLASTADIIRQSPEKLNTLPFTLAVIKESLRICPIALTVRQGDAGFTLTSDGASYPTESFQVQTGVWNIHLDPTYWPRVDEFLPERWLVAKGDPLYPVKNAWRPFEQGPMNCVGQELALLTTKLALIFVVREFDVEYGWEEWDQKR
ncbi:hypothetical protein SLS62_001525 [Diatrype stigma]|uniref:Cytochrome P450 n=1 Tax=Diatrype stigma TaxID=117547 RepID=A0AAN9V830_9PEZI